MYLRGLLLRGRGRGREGEGEGRGRRREGEEEGKGKRKGRGRKGGRESEKPLPAFRLRAGVRDVQGSRADGIVPLFRSPSYSEVFEPWRKPISTLPRLLIYLQPAHFETRQFPPTVMG